jgi:cysteine desulfurase
MTEDTAIYLDYAAATPLDERVLAAMQPYFAAKFYNPSATYAAANDARKALEAARTQVAHWLGALANEVIFTAGGTEANNLAIHGVMRQFPEANIVVSGIEHESVLAPAEHYNSRIAAVKPDGTIDLEGLRGLIDKQTVLVSIMYANNEVGTIQPLREISQIIETKRCERGAGGLPLYLHTDACQAANYLDLHAARLGVDLLTINGGKLYGPKQSGALYVKRTVGLRPLIDGGGQERGLRSGTENVAGSIGLAAALDMAQASRHDETARLQVLQRQFFDLLAQKIPAATVNGSLKRRLPNNVHLTVPGQDNERLLLQLDERGIQAAAGSACSASDEAPSHVLRALGLSDAQARSSLRFTMGRSTTTSNIERLVDALRTLTVRE